ncbi:MAG: hypothetical protein ABIY55_09405, partial [Kofleriaceae bacterium]
IDPERGRAMGPTPPAPGLRARRRYQLRCWQALGAEAVHAAPQRKDDGVYAFASDGASAALTDDDGNALRLAFEGQAGPPVPRADERLIVAREPSARLSGHRTGLVEPFVLLPPGQAYVPALPALAHPGALALDPSGLARLFSIEDAWGWDRYPIVRLVRRFGAAPPADDTVEVDVERGRLRIGPGHAEPELRVRYFRRFDLKTARRTGETTISDHTPLGRSARVTFKDTDSKTGRP